MGDCFGQAGYGTRFEWGPVGAERIAADVACLVVVDVLSFTTSVTVAVELGTRVLPYRWRDATAAAFAEEAGASLAVGRRAVTKASPWSLSPAALRRAPATPRLVLPSPNGSAIDAAAGTATVVAGCLRNASAVGRWLAVHGYGTTECPVGVIASGERWPDDSLRPALEDLLGAGAVIASVRWHGGGTCSPEAVMAADCFLTSSEARSAVTASSSGRELAVEGFAEDIVIATELDACAAVPVLAAGSFGPAG